MNSALYKHRLTTYYRHASARLISCIMVNNINVQQFNEENPLGVMVIYILFIIICISQTTCTPLRLTKIEINTGYQVSGFKFIFSVSWIVCCRWEIVAASRSGPPLKTPWVKFHIVLKQMPVRLIVQGVRWRQPCTSGPHCSNSHLGSLPATLIR